MSENVSGELIPKTESEDQISDMTPSQSHLETPKLNVDTPPIKKIENFPSGQTEDYSKKKSPAHGISRIYSNAEFNHKVKITALNDEEINASAVSSRKIPYCKGSQKIFPQNINKQNDKFANIVFDGKEKQEESLTSKTSKNSNNNSIKFATRKPSKLSFGRNGSEMTKKLAYNLAKNELKKKRNSVFDNDFTNKCILIKKGNSKITMENLLNRNKGQINSLILGKNTQTFSNNMFGIYDCIGDTKSKKAKCKFENKQKDQEDELFSPCNVKVTEFQGKINNLFNTHRKESSFSLFYKESQKYFKKNERSDALLVRESKKINTSNYSYDESSEETIFSEGDEELEKLIDEDKRIGGFPFIGEEIIYLDQEIKFFDKLEIKDVIGDVFQKQKIMINAGGIASGGLRQKRDGVTNFGVLTEPVRSYFINAGENFQHNALIDYFLNIKPRFLPKKSTLKLSFKANPLEVAKEFEDAKKKCFIEDKLKDEGDVIFQIIFCDKVMKYLFHPNLNNKSNITIFRKIDKVIPVYKKKHIIINNKIFIFQSNPLTPDHITVSTLNRNVEQQKSVEYTTKDMVYRTLGSGEIGKLFFMEDNEDWYITYYEEKYIWVLNNNLYGTPEYCDSCWEILEKDLIINKKEVFKIGTNVFQIKLIGE